MIAADDRHRASWPLLALMLTLNGTAIWLRIRLQRKNLGRVGL